MRFPIYLEKDIFESEFENLLEKNICELHHDDDIETDEEMLCAGI